MIKEPNSLLKLIVKYFLESSQKGSFNGISVGKLYSGFADTEPKLIRMQLGDLVSGGKVNCVFDEVNPHIKRYEDLPKENQIKELLSKGCGSFCIYPTASVIRNNFDVNSWDDRPFSKLLLLGVPQISFKAFEMGALERYTNDPRYVVNFKDYMGNMSISSEYYNSEDISDRDKVSVQYFGLGHDKQRRPYLIVYLRYLHDLTPEHQQYWNSFSSQT